MAMQLSRYASVRYVHARKSAAAQQIIPLCMLSVGFAAFILGYVILVDNFRLASFWLNSSADTYRAIATIFALSAPL
jgi:cytochrome c biogenesis factor